jgi:UDP-glucose 4-epimerase
MTSPEQIRHAIVLGASGFVGTRLVSKLNRGGTRITAIAREARAADGRNVDWRIADIRDPAAIERAIAHLTAADRAEAILFHLAGESDAGRSHEDPRAAVAINVVGTMNVADVCRMSGIRRVVFVSSGQVYAPTKQEIVDEQAPTAARGMYGATKLAAEALLSGYAAAYGSAVEIARVANSYGPGTPENSVIGRLMGQLAGGAESISLRNLAPRRDFIHVDDVAAALEGLGRAASVPGVRISNIGSGMKASIREIAEMARHAARSSAEIHETAPAPDPQDVPALDASYLRARTGWKPQFTLETGLREMLLVLEPSRA